MLSLLVLAVVVAIVIGLVCILLGKILNSLGIPIATAVGSFLTQWAWVIGVVAGIWYFFTGGDVHLRF